MSIVRNWGGGGSGKIIEVDEAKFGKRKFNVGRMIKGQWVFGGFERESKKFFLVPVPARNKEYLLQVIQDWILPGTVVPQSFLIVGRHMTV